VSYTGPDNAETSRRGNRHAKARHGSGDAESDAVLPFSFGYTWLTWTTPVTIAKPAYIDRPVRYSSFLPYTSASLPEKVRPLGVSWRIDTVRTRQRQVCRLKRPIGTVALILRDPVLFWVSGLLQSLWIQPVISLATKSTHAEKVGQQHSCREDNYPRGG
jgi:hypothetical protein